MKKLGKIKHIVCALGVFALVASCTDNYKEWNTDPTEVPEDMLVGLMKIGNFFPTMEMDVIPTTDVDANQFQRAQNLCGDMHSGYMTPIVPGDQLLHVIIICDMINGMMWHSKLHLLM